MSKKYPSLESMGVRNPEQIISYTVSQPRTDTDVLRLKYKRPKGSFLPVTRRYEFGRAAKPSISDSGTRNTTTMYEISPLLVKAMGELDSIVSGERSRSDLKEAMIEEISRIEQDLDALRQMVGKL